MLGRLPGSRRNIGEIADSSVNPVAAEWAAVYYGTVWAILLALGEVGRGLVEPAKRKANMTEKNSGPEEGIKAVVEDVKGKAKEAVGTVTGRDDLVSEGKAQQDKADAQKDVAKKEAEAESARAGAKAAEKRQEAYQRP